MTLGIDIGSGYTKAVILEQGKILSHAILPSGGDYKKRAREVTARALAHLSPGDICTMATGYGASAVDAPNTTDLSCHAAGIHHLFPSVRTVIDIGAQFSRAIRIDDKGKITNFVLNEKCAGGSGKFLQVMSRILHVPLSELSDLPSTRPVDFTTGCAVFAESEAVSRIAEGASPGDIVAGVYKAMAAKIVNLVTRVGLVHECAVTGGGAMHRGLIKAIEKELAISVRVPEEPRITAALGAALLC
jgi:predicted CoA-substrate-specific enzyme activase